MSAKSSKPPHDNPIGDIQRKVAASFRAAGASSPALERLLSHGRAEPPPPVRVEFTWSDPDMSLLRDDKPAAPPFPMDALGAFWSKWCVASAENANAPVDYTIGTLLATVGALLGNVRWPDVEGVWEHPSVLWIGLVGNPSTAKSPGMRPVRKLISRLEIERAKAVADAGPAHRLKAIVAEYAEREWRREVENTLATRAMPAKGKIAKPVPKPRPKITAAGAARAIDDPYEGLPNWPQEAQIPATPVLPVLHVVDATIEALVATAAGSTRGLLQFSDELAGWFGGFDRYRAKGVSADRPFWLKAFDGDPYSVIRKGSELRNGVRAPVEIAHLSIGVIGSVQPDPLRQFLTSTDDGLAHRFLWMWPERTLTFQIRRRTDTKAKADDEAASDAFRALDALPVGREGEPVRIPLCAAATDRLETYGRRVTNEAEGVSAWYASTLGKAPGLALRLSLVLTYLRWSGGAQVVEPTEIQEEEMVEAIRLMDTYFMPQGARVRDCAAITDGESDARALLSLIRTQKWTERFTGRMIHRVASGRLADTRIRKATLDTLVDAGLLHEDFQREGRTPGRKKEWYRVSPRVFDPRAIIPALEWKGVRPVEDAA